MDRKMEKPGSHENGMANGFQNGFKSHRQITREEVKQHDKMDDKWLVIAGKVYDITTWAKRHPGGARIISHFAGEDATDAWTAFHDQKDYVRKFLNPLYVGDVKDNKETELAQDFRKLRKMVEDTGMLKVKPWFFVAHFMHILALEAIAYCVMWYFGTGWLPWLTVVLLLTTSQAQLGWTQHDYGHLSVFSNNKLNHIFHHITIGFLKGASSHWWNFRHFQHHAKPNIFKKDPDVGAAPVFLLGEKLPAIFGRKKRAFMPYNFQHEYFFLFGPPITLPVYFHIENVYFILKRRDWVDLTMSLLFFVKLFSMYGPFLGGWGTFGMYMTVRFVESHWFTWVTQMNHIPMAIDFETHQDWFHAQLAASCNVHPSFFNDWFTGHLNFQIEHHLFPTMPRHNYHLVKPFVESICKKHGVEYQSKTLTTAFCDIYRSLRKSGQLWYDAYNAE